jgi:hypothetical protein
LDEYGVFNFAASYRIIEVAHNSYRNTQEVFGELV